MLRGMRTSRALALAGGILLPMVETARRWHELADWRMFPFWFDDWIIALLLLYGFWRTRNNADAGRAMLAAAWGFACGMGYSSLFSTLSDLSMADPSGIPAARVAAIKLVMVTVAVVALIQTLRSKPADGSKIRP
jgi:hypothetical protein